MSGKSDTTGSALKSSNTAAILAGHDLFMRKHKESGSPTHPDDITEGEERAAYEASSQGKKFRDERNSLQQGKLIRATAELQQFSYPE